MNTYYELLGITNKAKEQQIRDAYKATAFLCHPDRTGNMDSTLFDLVKVVSTILLDKNKRRIYDKFATEQALLKYNDDLESDEVQFPTQKTIGKACEILRDLREKQTTVTAVWQQKKIETEQNTLDVYRLEQKTEQAKIAEQIIQAIFKKTEETIYLELFAWMIQLNDSSSLLPSSNALALSETHEKIYRATKILMLEIKPTGLTNIQSALHFLEEENEAIANKASRNILSPEDFRIDANVIRAAYTYYSSFTSLKTAVPRSKDLLTQLLNIAQDPEKQVVWMSHANFYDLRSILLSEEGIKKCSNANISIHLMITYYLEKFRDSVTQDEQEQMIYDDARELANRLLIIAEKQPEVIDIILNQIIDAQNYQTLFMQQLYTSLVNDYLNAAQKKTQKYSALGVTLDELGAQYFCEEKSLWPYFIMLTSKNLEVFFRCNKNIIEKSLTPEWLVTLCQHNDTELLKKVMSHYVNQESAMCHFDYLFFDILIKYRNTPKKIVITMNGLLPLFTDEKTIHFKNSLLSIYQYFNACLREEQEEHRETAIVLSSSARCNSPVTAPSRIFFEDASLLEDAQAVLSGILMKTDNVFIWKEFLNRLDLKSCIQFLLKLEKIEVVEWNIRSFLVNALNEQVSQQTLDPLLSVLLNQEENRVLLKQIANSSVDETKNALKNNIKSILAYLDANRIIKERAKSEPVVSRGGVFSMMGSMLFGRAQSHGTSAIITNNTHNQAEKMDDLNSNGSLSPNPLEKDTHDINTEKYPELNPIDEGIHRKRIK